MCQFIPNYVFKHIINHGTPAEQKSARQSLIMAKNFAYDPKAVYNEQLLVNKTVEACKEVVGSNPALSIEAYMQDTSAWGSLVAQVMKLTNGTAIPQLVNETLKRLIDGVAAPGRNREVYDAETKMQLPGKLVLVENPKDRKNSKDDSVNHAYDNSGHVYDFLREIFGRNSIDDQGLKLISTVNFGKKFNNAFWNNFQMTYGKGDQIIFNDFAACLDVAGHEIFHGVVSRSAGLIYHGQSGALNEHYADVFGSMVKQWVRKQMAKEADWIIGEGLFTKKINGVGIRSMKAPGTAYNDPDTIGKDRQPDHMKDYDPDMSEDNFGVHVWSGIMNKSFYNVATNLGNVSWGPAGKIWYETLLNSLKPNSQFQDAADALVKNAAKMYGVKSNECKAVIDGLFQVGLKPSHNLQ